MRVNSGVRSVEGETKKLMRCFHIQPLPRMPELEKYSNEVLFTQRPVNFIRSGESHECNLKKTQESTEVVCKLYLGAWPG